MHENSALAAGTEPESRTAITRREFFTNLLVGAAILGSAGGVINTVIRYLIPPSEGVRSEAEQVEIGTVNELAPGASKKLVYMGKPCILVNVGGQFRAFGLACTHLGCLVEWDGGSSVFKCPCHAGVFDSTGRVVSGPPPKALRQIRTSVSNGKVFAGGWL